jgi:hypothetical protein
MAAISEYTTDSFRDPAKGWVTRVKLKLCDKRAALVDLGRHLGMFTAGNKHEVTITDQTALADARDELLRRYDRLAAAITAETAAPGGSVH